MHGPRHPLTALSHANMGLVFEKQGDHAGALEAYGKALTIDEQVYGPQSKDVGDTFKNMANAYAAQGERERARTFYERAAAAFAAALGPEHERTVNAREMAALADDPFDEALASAQQGNEAKAIELWRKSLEIREQVLGPQSEDVGDTCKNMAMAYDKLGEAEQARAFYGRAAAAYKAAGVDNEQSRYTAQQA